MKNIIVVGASKGIGLSLVQTLSADNNVVAIARNSSAELEQTGAKIVLLDAVKDDLSVLNDLPKEIHGLVYCPGSINLRPFNRLSIEDFRNDFEQNVMGAVRVIQHFLPHLKQSQGASVVLFSTVAAKLGMPFHASIATSKGAIEGLAKSLAAELAASKIRVNVVAPSLTDTPLTAQLLSSDDKREAAAKRHPLQRVGTAQDMAAIAQFLLSDQSSWITGQTIGVDGGIGTLKT